MTNDSLPPFSVRNRREIAPIDEIFPASAQIGLLHLLNEGMSRGFLTDWEKVAMELQRIARLPPRNYSSHREAQAEIQQLLDLLSWERQYDFCERLYSHLASASEYEDNGYVVRTEKSEAQQFFADELQRLFQEENLAFEFRDGLAQRRGRRHKGRTATMQIGELAKRTALTVDAIRFYEKRRLLPKPVRSTGRFRLYTVDDMERVRFIQQVQGLGFSLAEIRELIDLRSRKVDACESVRQLLKGKLSDVRAKMQELKGLESELITDLEKCTQELKRRQRHAAGACPVLEQVAGARK